MGKIEGGKTQGGRLVKPVVSSLPQGYPRVQQKQITQSRALLPCRFHCAEHLQEKNLERAEFYSLSLSLSFNVNPAACMQKLMVFCQKPPLLLVPSIVLRASSSTDPDGCTASARQSSPTTPATAL